MTTERKKVTLPVLQEKTSHGTPLTMITCYDYSMAHLVERAGFDMVLVGDSLGMTMLGYSSTLAVTMEDMVRHGGAVRRGCESSWLVIDMPYMSYQPSNEKAVESAGRLMAETGADAVKLEGGQEMAPRVEAIAKAGIPVMGHLGLTPQSASSLGGFKVQGRSSTSALRIVEDARCLESSGAFALLLELVPDRVAQIVTRGAGIPIIGLGAGPYTHGQLLIFHDLLNLFPDFHPRMAKVYADASTVILSGLAGFASEVARGEFPREDNTFGIADGELEALVARLKAPREGNGRPGKMES